MYRNRLLTLALSNCLPLAMAIIAAAPPAAAQGDDKARFALAQDDTAGQLQIGIDGREAVVYQYAAHWDMPHFYPLRSPSGQLLTVQKTEPYPHHRSVWFADTVQLSGQRSVSFYNAIRSPRADPQDPRSPHRDRIRHVALGPPSIEGRELRLDIQLVWEMDFDVPVLDERREVRLVALGDGEYLLDLTFIVTASHGDVTFVSDWSHYAWPYVRMHPQFSEQNGGRMVNSVGGVGEAEVMGVNALWVDYANTVEEKTEGLAIFSHSDNDHPHKWFNRGYGTFGPRRNDARSGVRFVLEQDNSLQRRVGLLVHRGDVQGGRVAERYRQYVANEL